MKKLKNILIGLVATISLTSVAYAGSFGLGVTGSYSTLKTSGSETTPAVTGASAETNKASVSNDVFLGSLFIEYSLNDASWASAGNGVTLGYQITPGTADVTDKVKSRTDTELSITGTVSTTSVSRTQTAKAEVDNYNNFYLEVPVYGKLFVKAGMSSIDVATTTTTTGANGGTINSNKKLDGTNLGIGLKGVTSSNIIWKLSYEQTDFDTLNLTSTTSNTIKADLDIEEAALSIGYRF